MSRLGKILLVVSAVSLLCFVVTRVLVGAWIPFMWIPLGLFVGGFIAAMVKDRRAVGGFLTMKTTKHGMNMGALISLVVIVLVVVNFLAVRHYKTWDFSGQQVNTLSPQSAQLVKNLDSELLVRFFYKKGVEGNEENRKAFRDLIKKYQDQSNQIKLEFVEVNERPDLAEQYGVTKGSGVIFLEYKGRKNRIEKIDEQEVSSALVKVTREKDKVIYFVVGHGERELDDAKEATGLNAFKLMLENNRYTVKTLATNLNAKVPDDADLVAVVGPSQNFQSYEIQGLADYLQRGGSLLLALESKQTVGLDRILAAVGLTPMNNYVFNVVETVMGKGIQQSQTMGTVFSSTSEISKVFGKGEAVVFRNPMSFKRNSVPDGLVLEDVVKAPEGSVSFDSLDIKGEGVQGSFPLVVSAKGKFLDAKTKDFNLLVTGDADFLGNQLLYQNLNRDLALNSIAWLANEKDMISIATKEAAVTKLTMTDTGFYLFLICFAIPLPVLLLATSTTLWMKRRHA
jgi:ABC-type uncharacterized transport system involved in gliding motility auxiliary subunit